MRKLSYAHIVDQEVELIGDYPIREERAIKKIASGLIKLLLPESFDKNKLRMIMDIAIEYRKRVNDWLHILEPGEFQKKKFEYELR